MRGEYGGLKAPALFLSDVKGDLGLNDDHSSRSEGCYDAMVMVVVGEEKLSGKA